MISYLTQYLKKTGRLVLAMTILVLVSAPSYAATAYLVAEEAVVTMPDGAVIPMWGFFEDNGQACDPATPPTWDIGPQITVPPGDTTLDINLRNCLDANPTSVLIPGQSLPLDSTGSVRPPTTMTDPQGRVRVTSFTSVTAAGGSTGVYSWNNLQPGTYVYQSGTHQALQVQMGLYGAVVSDTATGEAYPGVSYDQDIVFFYSEIDPAKHAPPSTPKPLDYRPRYFLVNGQPYNGDPAIPAGALQQNILLRFLNAGLKDHTPAIDTGHLDVIAENGQPYPYVRKQQSLNLAAGKTMDAVFTPAAVGTYTIYDRSLHLTTGGQFSQLSVVDAAGLPIADAGPDQSGVAVGGLVGLDGSTSTDPDTAPNPTLTYSWTITSLPTGSTAILSDPTIVNPTFTPDVGGSYSFELVVNDGASNSVPDSVKVTTNLPPVADAGQDATVDTGNIVSLDGSGSNDPDNYPNPALSYAWSILAVPVGSTAALSDPTVVNPTFTADLDGSYTFELIVDDGLVSSAADTVTITAGPPVNQPPVAVDDAATTPRETPVTIILVANDSDPDGTIDPASVVITNQPTRGGSVQNMLNGTVIYTPRRGFRGTDTFTYTVDDNVGATSNEATVRVNVVRQ